jgi:hypothetical protein
MLRDREPIRLPTWKNVLADYQHAFDAYHANPGSLPRTAFLDRALLRLEDAVRQPGKFELGLVALSQGAIRELIAGKHLAEEFLIRHKNGDWGNVDAEEAGNNLYAIAREYRITSRYETRQGAELWVSTYGNRSVTHLFTRQEH